VCGVATVVSGASSDAPGVGGVCSGAEISEALEVTYKKIVPVFAARCLRAPALHCIMPTGV
jgi:hypothetical protein